MKTKTIFLYFPGVEGYGVMVIINKIVELSKKRGLECIYVRTLNNVPKGSLVIPYSTEAAFKLIKYGYKPALLLLVDAYTLGEINKIKFYITHKRIFNYDLFYSVYAYLRNIWDEIRVLKLFPHIMLVSEVDIIYLKNLTSTKSHFLCVPNGVEIRKSIAPKIKTSKIRLGILSSWDKVSYEENAWFILTYYRQFLKQHKDVELVIAGRGEYSMKLCDYPSVRCLGEVEDLNDFFKNIDIFLAVNPKGCGILNRVLDAFSYKTVVLGYKNAMTGFTDMKDAYLVFDDYSSFVQGYKILTESPEYSQRLAEQAYEQIKIKYNWDVNINKLIDYIQNNL